MQPPKLTYSPYGGPYNPYKAHGPQIRNTMQPITKTILLTIAVVFLTQILVLATGNMELFYNLYTIQPEFWTKPWGVLTSIISHGSFMHLFMNGIGLYFFGSYAEQILQRRNYLTLFITAGIISGIIQVLIVPSPALGASGAIAALIGFIVVTFPKQKVTLFPIPITMRLWVLGVIFVAFDVFGAMGATNNIANFAHLAGFFIGLIYGLIRKQKAPKHQYY